MAEIGESVTEVVLKVVLFGALEAVALAPSETVGDVFVADAVDEGVAGDTSETLTLVVGLCAVFRRPDAYVVVGKVEAGLALKTEVRNELVPDAGGVIDEHTQAITQLITLGAGDT